MNCHELALKTYRDLQKRKVAKQKKANADCTTFKLELVTKSNKRNWKLRNR